MIKCFFEQGKEALGGGLRHVTMITIMVDDLEKPSRILLVKRAETMIACPGLWAFPGGFLDRDERVIDGAYREAEEETGFAVEGELKFLQYDDSPERGDDRQNVAFIWLGKAGKKVRAADEESSEVKWWDLDDLPAEEEWAFNHLNYISWIRK